MHVQALAELAWRFVAPAHVPARRSFFQQSSVDLTDRAGGGSCNDLLLHHLPSLLIARAFAEETPEKGPEERSQLVPEEFPRPDALVDIAAFEIEYDSQTLASAQSQPHQHSENKEDKQDQQYMSGIDDAGRHRTDLGRVNASPILRWVGGRWQRRSKARKQRAEEVEDGRDNPGQDLSNNAGQPIIDVAQEEPGRLQRGEEGRAENGGAEDGQDQQRQSHARDDAQHGAFLSGDAAFQAEGMDAASESDARQGMSHQGKIEEDGNEQNQDDIIGMTARAHACAQKNRGQQDEQTHPELAEDRPWLDSKLRQLHPSPAEIYSHGYNSQRLVEIAIERQ